jgi:hypothetical protein
MKTNFWIDCSNFSGRHDLFQVMGNKSRRLTYEGRKVAELSDNPDDFCLWHHGGNTMPDMPEEFAGLF